MSGLRNILLVYPRVPSNTYWSFKYALEFVRQKSVLPPLGLATLAGLIPETYRMRLVDMNITSLRSADIRWADVVFVSAMIVQQASFFIPSRSKRCGPHASAGQWTWISGLI